MQSVLMLNADWTPIRIVSWRRAVILILEERAEVLHESEGEIRSPSTSMAMPTVIRLRSMVKVPYRAVIPLTRRAVMERDRHECGYCLKYATTIDHIQPRSRGGKHTWENVVAACKKCNAAKDDRLLSEIGWRLRKQVYRPSGRQWLIIGLAAEVHGDWRTYLGLEETPIAEAAALVG